LEIREQEVGSYTRKYIYQNNTNTQILSKVILFGKGIKTAKKNFCSANKVLQYASNCPTQLVEDQRIKKLAIKKELNNHPIQKLQRLYWRKQ
jgi:hypothetical protein